MAKNAELVEVVETVKAMHRVLIDMQASFVATQISLISVVQKLSESRGLNSDSLAQRMRELAALQMTISQTALEATDRLAQDIEEVAEPRAPAPQQGGKPRLVE